MIGARQTAGGAPAVDGSTMLETIIVSGKTNRNAASGSGFQGTPDWVYQTPSSVSVVSREAIRNSATRNSRELFADVPGVVVSNDNAQSQGLNVNIRGLQDQTRINMMIDGARQNFQRSAHGSTGLTYVDPAFIRQVDIEKSGTSGVGGAASLGGSVNFRTLVADDLIEAGRNWGAEIDGTTGTNAYHFAGNASAAIRLSDSFSILGGISYKDVGKYDIGSRHPNTTNLGNVYDQMPWGSETWSGLLKTEMQPTDDTTLDLSWLHYDTEFAQGTDSNLQNDVNDVTNDTVTASFGWDPDSELIDLKTRLWYNRVKDEEHRSQRTSSMREVFVDYTMSGVGGSIENTSRFDLPIGNLSLNYGVEAFRDDGDTKANGDDITDDPDEAWWYQGANGSGTRDVVSGFANATLDHDDWLSVSGGIRYDYYTIDGSTTVFSELKQIKIDPDCVWRCATITIPQEAYAADVDLSGGAWSPTFGVTVKPADGLQLFAKYAHTYRPPTVMEAVMGGTHVGGASSGTGRFAPNPWIEPEQADTFEIGANLSYDSVFQAGDSFRAKAVAFYRRVDNYIAIGTVDLDEETYQTNFGAYVNLDGTTPMRGVELEANYDAGRYYIGGSFSYLDADYATTYTYNGTSHLTDSYILFVPPRTKFSLDGGVRFFEEKLTLGGRVTHVGAADKNIGGSASAGLVSSWQTGDYTLFDIYGSYKFNPKTTLRFAVNNVTDVAYVPALGQSTLPAPGRTVTASLNFKF
ncbi:TonB-dependent hemoglobin/transferrin/lactoferrin family receptor [Rhizobiaceae bacterium BDR2-2]|uniref:TonB-dependent hemoglobin/transferrin/lactoferrin family receptor n=1 Tax=Ectorhizobium quercum TaxID=2965071 RepID=A0AAE3SY22_9HYPH|nr:TonB-dependent hemoglobin/transferrin/lactoferrin family receptor [Ectorhizobium quercum]MCX8999714.1 TonB-dependent hemoglobin/transferrin/lactoferrin family receptor [Ectorhizobium quercum]